MALTYPSAAALAASIQLRRRSLPIDNVLLIVEGSTDGRSLLPFLNEKVHLVPSTGKDYLLGAYEALKQDPPINCLYLVDCDGQIDSRWLGQPDLIVSEYRDIEVDLLRVLRSFEVVGPEYLWNGQGSVGTARDLAAELCDFALDMAAVFGVIIDSAREAGLKIRIRDPHTGNLRRIRLGDLASFDSWIGSGKVPSQEVMIEAISQFVGWSHTEKVEILESAQVGGRKHCRLHSLTCCRDCVARRFSNGHDTVAVLAALISEKGGVERLPLAAVTHALRIGGRIDRVHSWDVARRATLWAESNGAIVFNGMTDAA